MPVIGVVAAVCIGAVLAGLVAVVSRLRAPATPPPATSSTTSPRPPAKGIVGVLSRNRWVRRCLSLTSIVIGIVAVGLLGYPLYTNLYAGRVQDRLEREFASDDFADAYANCRTVGLADESCEIGEGDSLTRIVVPAIDVDVVVVEGIGASALRAGAGHYPATPLPCEPGNVAIAGHRTTYGRPFHNLGLLQPGDEITLQVPIGECRYRVTGATIVGPDDIGVVAATMDQRLTLTTCHPKGSARQRLVVTAELVEPLVTTAT